MKKLIVVILAAIAVASSSYAFALESSEAAIIQQKAQKFLGETPDNNFLLQPLEVLARINSGKKDFVLVDVRSFKEFKTWHLPQAINIPYREIAELENLAKLPKDKEVILYCNSGHESTKVLSVLRMLDYKAFGMKWGMIAWKQVPATSAALKAIADGVNGSFPAEI
jgi:rhodanese-related sulfurtransferase